MKIAFLNPPWWDATGKGLRYGIRAGSRWPFTVQAHCKPDEYSFGAYLPHPFFLSYAASYAQRAFPEAQVILRDSIAMRESYESFLVWMTTEAPEWVVMESATPSWDHDMRVCRYVAAVHPSVKIIITGTITTTRAEEALSIPGVAAAVKGEYEKGVARVIAGERGVIEHDLLTVAEMNEAPFPMFQPETAANYWDACPTGQVAPQLQVWSSRGCPFRCLHGDTPVNTVEGMIPIRELVGRESIGVFTYDHVERTAKVSTARNIRKYGEDERLVRVRFDDGTHIDCTPDHKFVAFKWGNQFVGEREWISEAQDLTPGTHVRAIKTSMGGSYLDVAWDRKHRGKVHRMVMEWMLGRRLTDTEQVHHIDHNKLNNLPNNLELCSDAKEHSAKHPEIAERMRTNNPTKGGMSEEWKARIRAGITGLRRSDESRERYRRAAILREAKRRARGTDGRFEPEDIVNHRVVSVEPLDGVHDVFCLEVPETGWFYANNVLVKNCSFCAWPATMTGNDPDGTGKRAVRNYSPEYMEEFLARAIREYGFRSIYDDSDTFNLQERHTIAMCEVYRKTGLPWSAMCRADTISEETWKLMKDSGCFGVKIGFESGSQRVVDKIINKRLDLKAAAETARFLRSIGMTVHGTFSIGHPGETRAEAQQTVHLIKQLYVSGGLDTHQLSGTAVIEGTPLDTIEHGKHLKAYDAAVIDGNYIRSTDGQAKIEGMLNPCK